MWVVLIPMLLIVGAVIVGLWLRRSGMLPTWLTDSDPLHLPAQALVFLAVVFLPFISIPVMLVYVGRQRRPDRAAGSGPAAE